MYLLVSLFCLLVSFLLFRKAAGTLSLTKPTMIGWVFYFYLVLQSFIASILVVYEIDGHYMISDVQNTVSRVYGWASVQYTMIMVPLAMVITMYLYGRCRNNSAKLQLFIEKPVQNSLTVRDGTIRTFLYILTVFSFFSFIYIILFTKNIPILNIFSLSFDELAIARVETTRGFEGNTYLKNISMFMTQILSFIAFAYWKYTSRNSDRYWFILLFVITIFFKVYDLSKSPVIIYLLSFLFIKVLLGYELKIKKLIFYFFFLFLLIFLMYALTMDFEVLNSQLFSYNSGIIGRTILSQSAGTYLAFDLFPSTYDFLGLSSMTSLFGENSDRMSRLIMMAVNPVGVLEGRAGVVNSLFIAEAWANFGIWGVVFAPILVGGYVQIIYQTIIQNNKTPLKLGLYGYFSVNLPVTGGFNDFIYNPTLFLVLFIFLFILILAKIKARNT